MIVKTSHNITVVCQGGWKYTGELVDHSYNLFSGMKWIKLKTKTDKTIIINNIFIVSILYAH